MENQTFPFLIAGLGNPGREYRETRHNIGFMIIDRLCKDAGVSLSRVQSKALVAVASMEDGSVEGMRSERRRARDCRVTHGDRPQPTAGRE